MEELGILRKVLEDEREVRDKLVQVCDKLGHNTQQYVHDGGRMFKEKDQIGHHLRRIELMEKMASRINKMVSTLKAASLKPFADPSADAEPGQLSDLLDQKQKRASYEGTLASISYARQRA